MAGQEGPLRVEVGDEAEKTVFIDPDTGTVTEMQGDGGAVVHLDAHRPKKDDDGQDDWFKNLADDVDLTSITDDLIEAIKADDQSRSGWLQQTSEGLDQMAIKVEKPSASTTSSSSEGPVLSSVRSPLLLDAVLRGWANAEAELLPASGPVKIKSDGRETVGEDDQADRLERAVNRYLTFTATEYYPETSHMLLWGTYFRGSGFKKVYRCPRRRRPVSEKVDGKDLIVSDTATDLKSCGRVTHEITMRPSIFKLMVMLGAYRKTAAPPPNPVPNAVDTKIAGIQGTQSVPERPDDKPYTLWETQCELDLDEFIPAGSKFKGEGIPLPYLVTIDKDNEQVLAIRRDWDEDDKFCTRKRMYVRYPYVPGPGFYGTGMLSILGNSTMAMTAAWREALDAGMFASFPGGLIAKLGGRQINTDFQMGPGEFKAVETNGMPIGQIVSNIPYRDVTPGLMQMMDKITEQSKSLGQAAEIPAAEGIANVPVGTMLAQIEQATKVMAAAHKGMHTAQSEEIQLLVDLFRRHPEDLIESDGDNLQGWDATQLLAALDNVQLVPVSDPNVPSHIHRVAKALGLVQLMQIPVFAARLDPDEVLKRILAAMREDGAGLQVPAPPAQPQVPLGDQAKMVDAQAKAKKVDADIASKGTDNALKQQELRTDLATRQMDLKKEEVIHASDPLKAKLDIAKVQADVQGKHAAVAQGEIDSRRKTGVELLKAGIDVHKSDREHGLAVAEHQQGAVESQRDHQLGVAEHAANAQNQAQHSAVETHKALNPPEPVKPTKGKK